MREYLVQILHEIEFEDLREKGTGSLNLPAEANKNSFIRTFGAKSGSIMGIAKWLLPQSKELKD